MTVDEVLRQAATDLAADVRATTDAEAALDRVTARPERRRPWLPVAAAVIVLLGLAAVVAVAVADDGGEDVRSVPPSTATVHPTTAGPATGESDGVPMTVDPATGLADGDQVQVTVGGRPTGGDAGFVMCTADALATGQGAQACQGVSWEGPTDPADTIEARVTVERLLSVGDGGEIVDCAREVRCAVGVVVEVPQPAEPGEPVGFRQELRGLVAVAFAPQDALAAPTVQVTPTEGLRHGDTVTVTGEHFGDAVGSGEICTDDAEQTCGFTVVARDRTTDHEVRTDDGAFEVEVEVWRSFLGPGGRIVDCAVERCTLRILGSDGRSAPPVPLRFDPAVPRPEVPTIAVTPATGLRPGDPVTIAVAGLLPRREVEVTACIAERGFACGRSETVLTLVADAEGRARTTTTALAGFPQGADCTQVGRCAVSLSDPISFGGDQMINTVRPAPVQYAPP